jgi:3-hydroxy-9,10-secoandrosta-1,3,5(10)-triene-9,17-dione monooxygenase
MPLDPTAVLDRVRDLAPRWADRAAAADVTGAIAADTAAELTDIGAHRLLQPTRFGGAGSTIGAHVEAVAAAAEGCTSTAWCLAVWSVHNWMLGLFGAEAQDDVWGDDPTARISASIVPRNRFATTPSGGLRVTGRYPFMSGCDHATWFGVGGVTDGAYGPDGSAGAAEDRVIALVPRPAGTIDHGSWAVMGLRGSGSKDVTVGDDVEVPGHRVLSVPAAARLQAPGQHDGAEAVYFAPFRATAALVLAPPALGAARAALRRFVQRTGSHRVGLPPRPQREDPAAGLRIARASAEIDAAALVMANAAAGLDRIAAARRAATSLESATVVRDTAFSVRLCADAVDRLYESSGGSALASDEPMQRYWRDVHAARSHTILTWDNAANEYRAAHDAEHA